MEPLLVALGGFFVALGYYAYHHPDSGRSFVSARTWRNTPNLVERLHERPNRRYAIFCMLFGGAFLLLGLWL